MTKAELIEIAARSKITVRKTWPKDKVLQTVQSKLAELIHCVRKDIEHHEKWSKSYFWSSRGNANSRRRDEAKNSYTREIQLNGATYRFESSVSISCKNVYYTGSFELDGNRKNLLLWRKLLVELHRLEALTA
jgi:hypothetical protein